MICMMCVLGPFKHCPFRKSLGDRPPGLSVDHLTFLAMLRSRECCLIRVRRKCLLFSRDAIPAEDVR